MSDELPEEVARRLFMGQQIANRLRELGLLYRPILPYPPRRALEMTLELFKPKELKT